VSLPRTRYRVRAEDLPDFRKSCPPHTLPHDHNRWLGVAEQEGESICEAKKGEGFTSVNAGRKSDSSAD